MQNLDFFITDHLGSVRAVVNIPAGTIAERDDYMAYGTTVPNATDSTAFPRLASNLYGFSGKEELNTTLSVPYLDFGARIYDSFTASWLSPDPLAADYPGISPYAYCAGDPVNLVDPFGLFNINTGEIEPGDNLKMILNQINKKFQTNLSLDDLMVVNNIKDINNLVVGSHIVLPESSVSLCFDLENLYAIDINYEVRLPRLSWSATSGRKGYQSKEYQKEMNTGPIPEGEYLIDPKRTQHYVNLPLKEKLYGLIGHGPWPGGTNSWGRYRTWITIPSTTSTYGRSKFSIHGGSTPGSAGCIDLTKDNDSFHQWFLSYNHSVVLVVKY